MLIYCIGVSLSGLNNNTVRDSEKQGPISGIKASREWKEKHWGERENGEGKELRLVVIFLTKALSCPWM